MNNEGFSLYEFHPIFEFFLTFYSVYLVSDELKIILDKKSSGIVDKNYSIVISNAKKRISDYIQGLIENVKLEDSKDKGTLSYSKSIQELIKHLTTVKDEAERYFSLNDNQDGIFKDVSATKNLKPFFLYFSIYNFGILVLCGFLKEPNFHVEQLNPMLLVFDTLSVSAMGILFYFNRLRRTHIPNWLVASAFFVFVFFSYLNYHIDLVGSQSLLSKHNLTGCIASFNIFTAALPLVLLISSSMTISKSIINDCCDEKEKDFSARAKALYDGRSLTQAIQDAMPDLFERFEAAMRENEELRAERDRKKQSEDTSLKPESKTKPKSETDKKVRAVRKRRNNG